MRRRLVAGTFLVAAFCLAACSRQSLPDGVSHSIDQGDDASVAFDYPGNGGLVHISCDQTDVGFVDVVPEQEPPGKQGEVELYVAKFTTSYVTNSDGSRYPENHLGSSTSLVLYPHRSGTAFGLTFSIEAIKPTGAHSGVVQVHVERVPEATSGASPSAKPALWCA